MFLSQCPRPSGFDVDTKLLADSDRGLEKVRAKIELSETYGCIAARQIGSFECGHGPP